MFTFESIIRYSETDYKGELSLAAIINYFQDCSEFHSESRNAGATELTEQKTMWILNSWQIDIKRIPKRSEKITIGTIPHKIKGIEGHRNFFMRDETGNDIIIANSIWTFLDMEKQRPMRVNEEQIAAYPIEPALDMNYAPRKIDIKNLDENDFEVCETLVVPPSKLDLFGHMNNSQYVLLASDVLDQTYDYNEVRVEYKKSALLHDTVIIKQNRSDSRTVIKLENESGKLYAVVEFKRV